MKKIFLSFLLVGCVAPKTAVQECANYCKDIVNAPMVYSSTSVCMCKTDTGIKAKLGLCLIEAELDEAVNSCLEQSLAQCQESDTVRSNEDGSFCNNIEEAFKPRTIPQK